MFNLLLLPLLLAQALAPAADELNEGKNAKIDSERVSHANIAITLDSYSHVLPAMQREAADAVDRALFGS